MSEALKAALAYAARGWRIFPCNPKTKQPLIKGGFKSASIDPEQIKAWLERWPKALIGVATGPDSGIVVVDFDAGEDKDTGEVFELADLISKFESFVGCKMPDTCSSNTPRGGRHLFFELPDGFHIPSRVGIISRVDVRGAGGYVIVPPSVRADGVPYTWALAPDRCPPVKPPRPIVEALRRKGRTSPVAVPIADPGTSDDRYSIAYALAVLDGEASAIAATAKGGRNARLNLGAYRLGQILDFCDLGETKIFNTLEAAAAQSGLVAEDGIGAVRRTIASGMAAGRLNPRRPSSRAAKHNGRVATSNVQAGPASGQVDLELAHLELSDLGNARRFARRHAARLKSSAQGWFYWAGSQWVADGAELKVRQAVHETVDALKREASVMRKSEPMDDEGEF